MVLTVADVPRAAIADLLGRFGLDLCVQANAEPITGSYWGDCEAGGGCSPSISFRTKDTSDMAQRSFSLTDLL